MTNLEYLAWFLEDTYGAICFHNDPKDGFVKFDRDCGKEMETLAVYFANELDLMDEQTATRLSEKAGKDFYKRYVGARDIRLCPLNGTALLTRFSVLGQTIKIFGKAPLPYVGSINWIIDYFIGRNINNRYLGHSNNSSAAASSPSLSHDSINAGASMPLPANNNFKLNIGDNIKLTLEKYLTECGKPTITQENGFYVSPFDYTEEITTLSAYTAMAKMYFGDIVTNQFNLEFERMNRFRLLQKYLTKSEWEDFYNARGIENILPDITDKYDD